jgi:hypothetical protein
VLEWLAHDPGNFGIAQILPQARCRTRPSAGLSRQAVNLEPSSAPSLNDCSWREVQPHQSQECRNHNFINQRALQFPLFITLAASWITDVGQANPVLICPSAA